MNIFGFIVLYTCTPNEVAPPFHRLNHLNSQNNSYSFKRLNHLMSCELSRSCSASLCSIILTLKWKSFYGYTYGLIKIFFLNQYQKKKKKIY